MSKVIRAAVVDLETLSTRLDAVVVATGFVIIDRTDSTYHELHTYYAPLRFDNQLGHRHVDGDTMRWWMKQNDIARGEFAKTEFGITLSKSLSEMTDLFNQYQIDEVWSKGANFDIAILEYYMKTMTSTEAWTYKKPRCFRTIQALFPDCTENTPVKHHALEDARDEAKELHRITQKHFMRQPDTQRIMEP